MCTDRTRRLIRWTGGGFRIGLADLFVLVVFASFTPLTASAAVYVDACATPPGNGSPSNPYTTVALAVDMASAGATLVIAGGIYPESLVIDRTVVLTTSVGNAIIGAPLDRLWAGANNGDIFDEPNTAADPDKTLGAMLDKLAEANLRVLRVWVDYRLELDDDGNALPVGEYNDCILDAMDNLMVEAKARGIVLLIALQAYNWIYSPYYMGIDHYGWRRCTTPANLFAQLALNPSWEGGMFDSPYQQRMAAFGWGDYLHDSEAKDAYRQRVAHILQHRNPYLGNRKWKDINEVIWAWELMNEPDNIGDADVLIPWLDEMATYVKGIDPGTYVALGTHLCNRAGQAILDHNFVSADIYTYHTTAGCSLFYDVQEFMSPQGIGGMYGKLIFLEEYFVGGATAARGDGLGIPRMFWEYGYNFDGDDVWHSGEHKQLWNDVIVPEATDAWNTLRPCAGTIPWRVGEMVEALVGP